MIAWAMFVYLAGEHRVFLENMFPFIFGSGEENHSMFFQFLKSDFVFFTSLISFSVLAIFLQISFKKNNVQSIFE
jgi:hypothetical protein